MSHDIIATAKWSDAGIYKISAHVCFDPDSDLGDFDGYIEDDDIRESWARGDWNFMTLVVTASLNGIDLGSDAIGGVEYGLFPQQDAEGRPITAFIDPLEEPEYWQEQVEMAVRAADKTLHGLCAAIAPKD